MKSESIEGGLGELLDGNFLKEKIREYSGNIREYNLRKRKWQWDGKWEQSLLLSLQQDEGKTDSFDDSKFPFGDSSLSFGREDHDGKDDGSNDSKDCVEPHLDIKGSREGRRRERENTKYR